MRAAEARDMQDAMFDAPGALRCRCGHMLGGLRARKMMLM